MLGRMLLRFPARSRLSRPVPCPGPVLHNANADALPFTLALRTYATPGRPKSVVGEPSRPVKRSVKKAAAKPRDGTSAAEKKVAAKKKPKKTKAAAKPKKKVLTPEQKELAAKRKTAAATKQKELREKTKLSELKVVALDPPKSKALPNAWTAFFAEQMKKQLAGGQSVNVTKAATETSAKWKQMGPADVEHYNHECRIANEASQAAYTRWLQSKSAEQVRLANNARAILRKKYPKSAKWKDIQDPRTVKRPATSFNLFCSNRHASGDFNNIKVADRAKLMSQEWKALSESEKEKYGSLALEERRRYIDEFERVYGHPPKFATAEAEV